MAYGLPVIASDWSGYRNIVVDDHTGMLIRTLWACEADSMSAQLSAVGRLPTVEAFLAERTIVDTRQLRSALKALIQTPERRETMGQNGRLRVRQHFVWTQVLRQFEELWQEL